MMAKLKALWALFQKGKMVADPVKWKTRQITSNALAAVLIALVQTSEAFGYEIPVTGEAIDAIAVGLFALVNVVFTIVTTEKVGLPAGRKPDPG
jgi:hypothetical protein